MVTTISVSLPDELIDELDERLEYGDSRSEWVADAIEAKMESEAGNVPMPMAD